MKDFIEGIMIVYGAGFITKDLALEIIFSFMQKQYGINNPLEKIKRLNKT